MKPCKIRITPEMIINDMGIEKVSDFFCEFDTDGDPLYGTAGEIPQVHPRHDDWWIGETDLRFTVDLSGIYKITNMFIYNNNGAFPAFVRMGTPFSWEYERELVPEDKKWTKFDTEFETRYINFRFNNNKAPSEIVIYGYKIKDVTEEIPPVKEHKKTDMSVFVGMNGFINDADDICRAVSYIREYHPWRWTTEPNGEDTTLSMNPSLNKFWYFDDFYGRMKSFGIDVCPTITANDERSAKDGTHDTEDPANYLSYAKMLFQFVARYGSNKNIDPELIKVGKGQEKKIGLGYLTAVEALNEPDGTWLGRKQFFSPFESCAFLSMCYDGHEGMYKNVGVKQADPDFIFSMSGGAGFSLGYLKAMQFWATYNRKDKKLPFDVFNGHRYVGKKIFLDGKTENVDVNLADRGNSENTAFVGISPEEGDIVGSLKSVIEFRDRYYPEKQIWLTEFGWDTNQDYRTTNSAHAYGEYTGRQVQAMWLVREYLLLSSTTMERAAMYMSRDVGPEETSVGKYGSCGLVRFPIEEDPAHVIQGNKKDSFYYVYATKEILKNTHFDEVMDSGVENVYLFRYVTNDNKKIYAIWCGTSNGTKADNYQLSVGKSEYELAELEFEKHKGKRTPLENKDGILTVNVSEKPIFVIEK